MSDGYLSDKEQIEVIKQWWHRQGRFIAIAIVIGLLIGFGWRGWKQHEIKRSIAASRIYQSVIQAKQKNNTKAVIAGATVLVKKYPKTVYASLASLIAANAHVQEKNNAAALANLHWVVVHANAKRFKQVALISEARVLVADGQSKQALSLLSTTHDKSFQPLVDWVKGDAYTAMKAPKEARHYYQLAKQALAASPEAVALLNMKLATPDV